MMTNIAVWLLIALLLSVGVNFFLYWYIRKLLKKFLFISDNLSDLVEMLKAYKNHLKHISSLEMYYGDETIRFLLSHTNSLVEQLEEYENIYEITIPEEEQNNEQQDPDQEEEKEEIQVNEENVFYAGTRRRNN